jgi:hypothetical protein
VSIPTIRRHTLDVTPPATSACLLCGESFPRTAANQRLFCGKSHALKYRRIFGPIRQVRQDEGVRADAA